MAIIYDSEEVAQRYRLTDEDLDYYYRYIAAHLSLSASLELAKSPNLKTNTRGEEGFSTHQQELDEMVKKMSPKAAAAVNDYLHNPRVIY